MAAADHQQWSEGLVSIPGAQRFSPRFPAFRPDRNTTGTKPDLFFSVKDINAACQQEQIMYIDREFEIPDRP
ncbi:hypothetical protein [uncultured Pleomorphomonas sp.]|uniref:hypothetical protein n=1 Tax=uncultured Pleomorphomonas sp. TaxID=442121 RepID=UPI00258DDDF0|nr:hypothetical protein [uncultured Pleomorphomonas sp.]